MPRLGADLREISTERNLPTTGGGLTYTAVMTTEDKQSKKGKDMTVITYTIQGGDFDGFEILSYHVLEKDDGSFNKVGAAALKRELQPVVGDRVNSDDFDTNEVNDLLVTIMLKKDSFKDDDNEVVETVKLKRVIGLA